MNFEKLCVQVLQVFVLNFADPGREVVQSLGPPAVIVVHHVDALHQVALELFDVGALRQAAGEACDADVILNLTAIVVSPQVPGDTAAGVSSNIVEAGWHRCAFVASCFLLFGTFSAGRNGGLVRCTDDRLEGVLLSDQAAKCWTTSSLSVIGVETEATTQNQLAIETSQVHFTHLVEKGNSICVWNRVYGRGRLIDGKDRRGIPARFLIN